MTQIETLDALEAIYGAPSPRSLTKVVTRLTPAYRKWIGASRFVILSTVGPEGTDSTPRGDDGLVVKISDERTLLLPDWKGNNRLDNLRNIVRDPRVSLMFLVPGSDNVVRVNGRAVVTADPSVTEQFEQKGRNPKTVTVVTLDEAYFQCAKAVMRAGLWSRDDSAGLPSAGDFLKEVEPDFDGETYDVTYPDYAKGQMW
jgi:hypothetical protein